MSGQIDDVTAGFAEEFRFRDEGLGGVDRTDREQQDHQLVGLLRRTDVSAVGLGFIFHGMDRAARIAVRIAS